MGATITITCPTPGCSYRTSLRFDPGAENDAPGAAAAELKAEHPHHSTQPIWKFRKTGTDT